MWRAFFLAMGITACILGAQCLVVDNFVMADLQKPHTVQTAGNSLFNKNLGAQALPRTKKPPEWAPWSLMSTGAIVILYSITMNRQ